MQVIDIPDEWTEKLKTMSGEDAKQIYNYYNEHKPVKLESDLGVGATTEAALQATAQQFEVLPEAGEIFMGMNQVHYGNALRGFAETQNKDSLLSKLATGFGNAMRGAGEETIRTANRSLEEIRSQQAKEAVPISEEEREGMYFRTVATVPSFAATVGLSMIPYVGPALGAGFVGTQAFAGATTESIESYKQEHPEDKGLEGYLKATDKEIGKIYLKTLASMASEYALGDIPLSKSFKNMLREGRALRQGIKAGTLKPLTKMGVAGEAIKAGVKSGGQEGAEELIEGLAYTAIDYDKINTSDELWDRINDSMKDAVAAFFVAGPTGGGVYVASRANAISGVREALKNSMPEQDAATVAAITVDNHIRNLRDVALVSVQASTEFAQKRGEIYDRFSGEVAKAMRESGAFNNMSEEDFVEYVSETASKFADNISGMAIQRKQLIPQVLDANKIVYKDGQLFLEGYKGEQTTPEQKMFQESMDIAQENSRLDAMYPEYTGEEIDINGVQRTVYNSDGTRIAKSAEALRNFYNWFGDSKVVDEQGRPLVVYHGSKDSFEAFSKEKIGTGKGYVYGRGFYFTNREEGAKKFSGGFFTENKSGVIYPVYLKIENMYESSSVGAIPDEYDGRIVQFHGTEEGTKWFVVKEPNQIKSTSNRGTYSLTEDNIYNQEKSGSKKVYRGEYNAAKKAIKLFKDANLSTIPHELAHYYLDNMWTYVLSGMASNEYLDNFIAVRDFLGIKKDQLKLTTAQHEKFASAYEKYLRSGKAPNDKLVGAFNGYDRWLKGVYRDINEIKAQGKVNFELTPEMVQFFDNMTTGELMTPSESADVASIATTNEVKQADDKTVKEAKEVIKQTPVPETKPEFDVKPIETDGKKKESRLFARVKEATEIDGKMDYTVVDLDEQRKKAAKLWQQDPVRAENILNGVEQADDILRSALYTEQQRLALERGDRATFEASVRKQSAEATRIGQELSALRGVVEDITMPAYWLRYAENEAMKQLAKQMTPVFNKHIDKSVLQQLTSQLDADIKELYKKVNALENGKEKANALKDGITDLKKKYKGLDQPDMVFNQTGYEEMTQEYVEKKAKEALGIYLPDSMVDEIIQKARDLDTLSNQTDSLGLPTSAFFAKKAELEATVNRHTPTSQTKVALSIIGRSNMLTAPATTVLNVTTNASNYATQLELRKITNKVAGHTNDILVDENLRKQYRQKAWKVFWETGYDMSMLKDLTDTRLYKGESITHSEGDGVIRSIGRFAEKWVFSRLISAPDVYFKSMKAFTDFAANEATEIAYKEGLTGEKAKQRATEIWKDAILVEPQTEQGKSARQKAQVDSLVVTFQQDTWLSKKLVDFRERINDYTGDVGVGDVLSPFVKTPANVLSLSFDAAIGPFASPKNLIAAYNDVRRGQFNTIPVQQAVRQTTFATLAYTVMSLLVAALIEDDDYIPDYSQLTQSERNAVKEAGGAYGSVLIGGTYVSTDFFGPYETPLVAILNSRRYDSVIKGLSTTVFHQLSNAPVLKDFAESMESLKEIGEGQLGILEAVYDGVTDAVTTRAVPNLLNVIAKATDDYERETNRSAINKLKAKVPVLRQTLPEKVSKATGKKVETQPVWLQMLLGSRGHIKVDNKLADELKRLSEVGQGASLSDVTRTGDLKSVPDNKKQRINEEFAKEYSKLVGALVKTSEYKKKTDEEKKKAINKVREGVVRSLKTKYSKDIKKGLKKTK